MGHCRTIRYAFPKILIQTWKKAVQEYFYRVKLTQIDVDTTEVTASGAKFNMAADFGLFRLFSYI